MTSPIDTPNSDVVVRRVRADEVQALKAVRLRALKESPAAFGSTYADESKMSGHQWQERAEVGAAGIERVSFIAWRHGAPCGIVGGFRDPGGTIAEVVSMWTAPEVRRAGVGRMLIDEVLAWAAEFNATAVDLWVTRGNDAAQKLYESIGFEVTDDVAPLPSDPCKDEVRMRRPRER